MAGVHYHVVFRGIRDSRGGGVGTFVDENKRNPWEELSISFLTPSVAGFELRLCDHGSGCATTKPG